MTTKVPRIRFTPTADTHQALETISGKTGKPVAELIAGLMGFFESYLLDEAACLDQLDDIEAKLRDDLEEFWGPQLGFNMTACRWDQAQRAINRAQSRLDMLRNRDSSLVNQLLEVEPQGMA